MNYTEYKEKMNKLPNAAREVIKELEEQVAQADEKIYEIYGKGEITKQQWDVANELICDIGNENY